MEHPPLYCQECKSIHSSLKELLFVEQSTMRGFCSEDCIEKFYTPLITFYEGREKEKRSELGLSSEMVSELVGHPKYMEMLISSPDEVWKKDNELGDEVYSFLKKIKDGVHGEFYKIITCSLFNDQPAFIFSATATSSEQLVEFFRFGEKVKLDPIATSHVLDGETPSGSVNIEIDADSIELIDQKKSSLLADLLQVRSVADIPYEAFPLYDSFVGSTLESPDEVYKINDEAGDDLMIYISAENKDNVAFYYIVIAMQHEMTVKEGMQTLIPILSFPTVDGEVYRNYQSGEKITAPLKN